MSNVRPDGVNIDAAWGLIRTVLATGLSYNLSARRTVMQAAILTSSAPVGFLAGDQPLFNVRAVGKPEDTPPTELEIYYPLSPSRALLVDFGPPEPGLSTRAVSEMAVATYNYMVTQEAHEQVFAANRETLEEGAQGF